MVDPVHHVSLKLDTIVYIGPANGGITLHPSRTIRFTSLLNENEELSYEILPTLIERAVNSFSHEHHVIFSLIAEQAGAQWNIDELKDVGDEFYLQNG
jgi:hypothetical protein